VPCVLCEIRFLGFSRGARGARGARRERGVDWVKVRSMLCLYWAGHFRYFQSIFEPAGYLLVAAQAPEFLRRSICNEPVQQKQDD